MRIRKLSELEPGDLFVLARTFEFRDSLCFDDPIYSYQGNCTYYQVGLPINVIYHGKELVVKLELEK